MRDILEAFGDFAFGFLGGIALVCVLVIIMLLASLLIL